MHSLANRTALRRAFHTLDLTKGELSLINVIIEQGRGDTWTLMHGPKLGVKLASLMETSPRSTYRALQSLEERGLVRRGTDEHHRTTLTLTPRLYEAAHAKLQRKRVEALVGVKDWTYLEGTDDLADVIHERALEMEPGRYRDQVRSVARTLVRAKRGVPDTSPDYGGHRKRNVVDLQPRRLRYLQDRLDDRSGTESDNFGTESAMFVSKKAPSTRGRKAAQ